MDLRRDRVDGGDVVGRLTEALGQLGPYGDHAPKQNQLEAEYETLLKHNDSMWNKRLEDEQFKVRALELEIATLKSQFEGYREGVRQLRIDASRDPEDVVM